MTDQQKPLERFPPESLQVLAHYYRAEVFRAAHWRNRLDVTTNWAILALTAAFSVAFAGDISNLPEVSQPAGEPASASVSVAHIVFPITSLVVLLLLGIEARRYRYYDVWWTRARLLEGHVIVPALNPELPIRQGNWREFLSNDLLLPTFKVSFWEAVARRLASNYIYIYLLLFFGWVLRVYTAADADGNGGVTAAEFYRGCSYGFLHPLYSLGFEILVTAGVSSILFVNWKGRRITGEIRRKDPSAPSWPI